MKRNRVLAPAALLVVLVLAGCGAVDESFSAEDGATSPPEATATTVPVAATTTTRLDVELVPATTKMPSTTLPGDSAPGAPVFEPGDDPVAFAIADLAARLGAPEEEIELVDQQEVVWRDGSIGCPQPGFNYTQALVDGSRILLSYEDVTYSYHQGGGRAPFWCEDPAE